MPCYISAYMASHMATNWLKRHVRTSTRLQLIFQSDYGTSHRLEQLLLSEELMALPITLSTNDFEAK